MWFCLCVYTITIWLLGWVVSMRRSRKISKFQKHTFLLRWLQQGQNPGLFEAFLYEANQAGRVGLTAMKLDGRRSGLFLGFLSGSIIVSRVEAGTTSSRTA